MSEAAGELHTLGIEAKHVGDGEDANRSDNVVEFTASTAAVRVPSLHLGEQSTSVMAGDVMYAESILQNDGNAVENGLSVTASVSSVPPIPGLVVFFTVDGGDRPVAGSVDLMVPAGQNSTLRLEVLIPRMLHQTPGCLRFTSMVPLMAKGSQTHDGRSIGGARQQQLDVDVVRSNNLTVAWHCRSIGEHIDIVVMVTHYAEQQGWQVLATSDFSMKLVKHTPWAQGMLRSVRSQL